MMFCGSWTAGGSSRDAGTFGANITFKILEGTVNEDSIGMSVEGWIGVVGSEDAAPAVNKVSSRGAFVPLYAGLGFGRVRGDRASAGSEAGTLISDSSVSKEWLCFSLIALLACIIHDPCPDCHWMPLSDHLWLSQRPSWFPWLPLPSSYYSSS
jgi:hypothetical protein